MIRNTGIFDEDNNKWTRYRKKPQQMEILWTIHKQHKGKMPPRKLRIELAQKLRMRENQIYKWFWEIKHKQAEMGEVEPANRHISELTAEQRFEAFVSKQLKAYREQMQLKGCDGYGRKLTDDEVMISVKLFVGSLKREEDYEILAEEVQYDVGEAADRLLDKGEDTKMLKISIEYENGEPILLPKPSKPVKQGSRNSSRKVSRQGSTKLMMMKCPTFGEEDLGKMMIQQQKQPVKRVV